VADSSGDVSAHAHGDAASAGLHGPVRLIPHRSAMRQWLLAARGLFRV
jgi:hypothetical protein